MTFAMSKNVPTDYILLARGFVHSQLDIQASFEMSASKCIPADFHFLYYGDIFL